MTTDESIDVETSRLNALSDLDILDSEREESFDNLTRFAARLFNVPIVAVSIVSSDRLWFKSSVGLNVCEASRKSAFCDFVVRHSKLLHVPDSHQDKRFANSPLVTGEPFIRSYLGYPLSLDGEHILGTLCLIDTDIRHYNDEEIENLAYLARQVESLVQLHKVHHSFLKSQHALEIQVDGVSKALARYDALLENAPAGIVSIDAEGIIHSANAKLFRLFGYQEDELLGQNIKCLMPVRIVTSFQSYLESEQHASKDDIVLRVGEERELNGIHKQGSLVAIHLALSEVISPRGNTKEYIGIITDIREQKRQEHKILAERALLSTLHKGITNFSALLSGNQLWEFLQRSLLDLTQSDYSFIGEVVNGVDSRVLKIHAMSDRGWNDDATLLASQINLDEPVVGSNSLLLGKVCDEGDTVIFPTVEVTTNDDAAYAHLSNYLGIPILDHGEVIGMYAIANSQLTVNEELAQWLEPFTSTCSLLIRFYRMISEKESVLVQLQQAKDDIEAASRSKSEFLSSMSHELRTPLNSIIGFSQLLMSQTKHPLADKQLNQVGQIHASGKHLLTLINEILDLAKIEAGKLSLSIEACNVTSLVQESIATTLPMAYKAGINVAISIDQRLAVLADYTRLKQVLINLLSNAIKYNRQGGSVSVLLHPHDMYADINVIDTGIGIDMQKLDELFEPFNRMGAESSGIEGTGVGLALTKKLVESMNGEILVSSSPAGSTFTVRLPLAEESLQLVLSDDAVLDEDNLQNMSEASTASSLRVLYVEDNPANLYLMEEIFEDLDGCVLTNSLDPREGLAIANQIRPDLIILDINLPNIDGYELFNRLKSVPDLTNTPILALSANAMPADKAKGLAHGFDHYLTKPVDIPVLVALLKDYQHRQLEAAE